MQKVCVESIVISGRKDQTSFLMKWTRQKKGVRLFHDEYIEDTCSQHHKKIDFSNEPNEI